MGTGSQSEGLYLFDMQSDNSVGMCNVVTPPILSNDSGRLMGYYVEDHSHIYRKRLKEAFLVFRYIIRNQIYYKLVHCFSYMSSMYVYLLNDTCLFNTLARDYISSSSVPCIFLLLVTWDKHAKKST